MTSPTARHAPSSLRGWQQRALVAMRTWDAAADRPPFLIAAAPGSGKTRPALEFARELLLAGRINRVVVVCPTGPLTRQWAAAAAAAGVHLQPGAATPRPPGDFHGIAVTYARVAQAGLRWARHVGPETLVIADEAHHLGDELAWGEGFEAAFGPAKDRWLLLSGTPFRSDQAAIPGVRYEGGVAEADISYTYADAVRDGVCRPVSFIPYDGRLQWRSGDDVVEASFGDVLTGREAGRRYRTAISVELPDGLPRILQQANERLEGLRSGGHRDAAGLVVAADGEHARAIAKVLREVTGAPPLVVVHTDARASEKLTRFTASRDPWIVAVNMVSEGVDIPRLRVGVYATAAKTPLIFRQIVGRFVRTIPRRPVEASWMYLPADPVLRVHAAEVETELRHVLRPPSEEDPEALDELRVQRATEPDAPLEFVPVAADVSPQSQLALFAGGTPVITPAAPPAFPSAVPPPADTGRMPAFERRKLLRDKRRRLVGELSRRDRRTHAEINGWLNRETGVVRVEDATLEQLDRSCELLLQALTKRLSRR
jgi:superfamily II DNA or RNA helicase